MSSTWHNKNDTAASDTVYIFNYYEPIPQQEEPVLEDDRIHHKSKFQRRLAKQWSYYGSYK